MGLSMLLTLLVLYGSIEGFQPDFKPYPSFDNSITGLQKDGLIRGGCPFQHTKTTPQPIPTCGPAPKVCTKSRYRSLDGTCNNLKRPNWGAAMTPYVRLTRNHYSDGIHEMPKSVTGNPLPKVRDLSVHIFPDKDVVSSTYNLNAAQWGQIITHDMSLTAGVPQINAPQRCCKAGRVTEEGKNTSTCAPIMIPGDDPIYPGGKTHCLDFERTKTTMDVKCTSANAPAQPLTAVTGFMDLSLVYGNNVSRSDSLRTKSGGRLITEVRHGQQWPPHEPDTTTKCDAKSNEDTCYYAGDIRMNQNTQLTALQVILLRNHNRIADKLAKLNPHWNDEKLFQESRRIHIAEIQHINYYEYLPILLGFENMVRQKLIYPGAFSYVDDYDPEVNPSIINEHGTAALRHFHTLIQGFLKRVSESRQFVGEVRLSDWLGKPKILEMKNYFDELTIGLTEQKMGASDQYYSKELTAYLFRGDLKFGTDLRSIDIQRGRDHGLGTYVEARDACKLPVPKTFKDMRDYISEKNVALLEKLYKSPEDVDLVVAGSLERHITGALAGPTFFCILMKQFYRTRVGDRYFYENGADPDIAFSPAQLEAIRKGANMARLLCDNGNGIRHMQRKAFLLVSNENPIIKCHQLPFIDLNHWRE